MISCLESSALVGINALPVRVEVDVHPGVPRFSIVGLPDISVSESYERVWAALRNSNLQPPLRCVLVNLAPGDIRKEGPRFDLPIALGVLAASDEEVIAKGSLEDTLFLGELAMDGAVRPVKGVLASLLTAKKRGLTKAYVPWLNAEEARLAEGMRIVAVRTLSEAVSRLNGQLVTDDDYRRGAWDDLEDYEKQLFVESGAKGELSLVCGQLAARRGLEICAAGGHHLLLIGPPGSGKTMLAQCLPSILPPLTAEQALEVTAIHSTLRKAAVSKLVDKPPFRSPASNVTLAGLMGSFQPGEISLAHHGVLFLDEFAEYRRDCLEALRAPLESGQVEIVRAKLHVTYPCHFILTAAMNPCPCGYFGDKEKACTCSYVSRNRYFHRISGPLLDRIDLQVQVLRPTAKELLLSEGGESSEQVRLRVIKATKIQRERGQCNARLTAEQTKKYCNFDKESRQFLYAAVERLSLSARVKDRLSRVARTIADLSGRSQIELADLCEALEYRALDRAMGE